MRTSTLRTVLLVKAIEDADPECKVLPLAERVSATREAHAAGQPARLAEGRGLPARVQRFLARRARLLLDRAAVRYPALRHVDSALLQARWLAPLVVLLALLGGYGLSLGDGSRRINLLAFPLLGLVGWNLAMYAALAVAWLRRVGMRRPGSQPGPARLLARAAFGWSRRLVRSADIPPSLATALSRFADAWWDAAGDLLTVRAKRLLHLGAAAAGLGLIGGLYLQGMVFEYLAGWESTFLEPAQVHSLIALVLGPASQLTGIPLPGPERIAALRLAGGAGGENAAPWVHLFAATLALFVVIPRLIIAALDTVALWRLRLRAAVPPALLLYYRELTGGIDDAPGLAAATVVPYSFSPTPAQREGLEALLGKAFGATMRIEFHEPVRYGEECRSVFGRASSREPRLSVLLFNLAATAEEDNHGALMDAGRVAARSGSYLLIVVDQASYAARFGRAAAYSPRIGERCASWREFARTHGVPVACIDTTSGSDPEQQAALARELAGALWSAPR